MNALSRYSLPYTISVVSGGLVLFGLLMVFSASGVQRTMIVGTSTWASMFHFFLRQLGWVAVGLLAALVCMQIRAPWWRKLARPAMALAILLLLLCFIPGISAPLKNPSGTYVCRWIGYGGVSFQPSELAKLLVIVYLAVTWGRRLELSDGRLGLSQVLPPLLICLVPIALILRQPDKSTALFLGFLVGTMWFLARGSLWQIGLGGLCLATGGAVAILHSDYSLVRLMDWWKTSPLEVWQSRNALISFDQGGWMGVGLGAGQQKLGFLPADHTDMIFALIAEEVGFFGLALVVTAYGVLAVTGMYVASRCANPVAALLAAGVTVLLIAQALLNMAVATLLVPTTGLCLPFISYGGSSLVVSMAAVGILIHVARSVQQADEAR